jgi:hypothetical protein
MRIFRKILIVLAIILLIVAAAGLLFFPSHIHVDRSVVISKPQKEVFNYVSDLHNWNSWSPWYKLDPNATYVYDGAATGVGSSLSWDSKVKDVGKGKLTIREDQPDSLVSLDLIFMDHGGATASFHLMPEGEATKVTWGFDSDAGANPLMRIMGSMMDKWIGKDFESGLAALKLNLESRPAMTAAADSTSMQSMNH